VTYSSDVSDESVGQQSDAEREREQVLNSTSAQNRPFSGIRSKKNKWDNQVNYGKY